MGSPRSAPPEWIVAFTGDFIIGVTALFLAFRIINKRTALLWGILLAWNTLGIFDLLGALSLTVTSPFQPIPKSV